MCVSESWPGHPPRGQPLSVVSTCVTCGAETVECFESKVSGGRTKLRRTARCLARSVMSESQADVAPGMGLITEWRGHGEDSGSQGSPALPLSDSGEGVSPSQPHVRPPVQRDRFPQEAASSSGQGLTPAGDPRLEPWLSHPSLCLLQEHHCCHWSGRSWAAGQLTSPDMRVRARRPH